LVLFNLIRSSAMTDKPTITTIPRAKRPRPGRPLKFEKPKMSYADTEDRLVKASKVEDPDFLSHFINQVVAVGELGESSDDHEATFSVSAIEDILSNESNGGAAKAMLAAQYAEVHRAIMTVSRRFARTIDLGAQDMLGRLLSSLARTSVAQYEALNRRQDTGGVNVGHVSVNEGGQAIVGNLTHNQQEPATEEIAPPRPLLSDARVAPMPIIEPCEQRVPVPVSRTEESER
jgi:hypothetical protein